MRFNYPWYISFLLIFTKSKYRKIINPLALDECEEYKTLFGKEYIIMRFRLPPIHEYCRCVISD